jgi:PAS domain S-box-containing protein
MKRDRVAEDIESARHRLERIASRVRGAAGVPGPDAGSLLEEMRSQLEEMQAQWELLVSEHHELQAERESLQQLLDLAPDACLATDIGGIIRQANRRACTLLAAGSEALIGRPIAEFVVEAERPLLRDRLSRVAGSGEPTEWQMTIGADADSPRIVVATVDAAKQGDSVVGLQWLLHEVSQEPRVQPVSFRLRQEQAARAHAEAAQRRDAFLAEASEILAGSLDYEVTLSSVSRLAVPRIAHSCIVYVVQEDGSVHRLGVAHADPAKEEVLRNLLQHRPFDPDSLTRPIARALRTGEAELLPDLPASETDPLPDELDDAEVAAGVCPRSLMIVPLRIRDRVLGALSFGWSTPGAYKPDDLWLARKLADRAALAIENARLHREAKRASEAKSDFVAAMSHEFRTPLTSILAFADMLVAGIPQPITGVPHRHAEQIVGAAKHLSQLIDQVLALSRIEAGRERVQRETVDLAALVRDTAALVEPLARQKGLSFTMEVPDRGPVIQTDPNKVRQVLFNLIGNAVKFTEKGGIRVALRAEQDRVVLEVQDTGEGIPPEHLERIWEPFWRAGQGGSGARRPPGTGLGLGIVKRLVHMLGAEIRARSEPGKGSVFAVELKVETGES